jgi:hypothetical protein
MGSSLIIKEQIKEGHLLFSDSIAHLEVMHVGPAKATQSMP